jgi:hypothetical protein
VLFVSQDPVCVVLQISSKNSRNITNTRAEDIRYLSQNNGSFIDGWVFTCKSKIMNLQTCLNDSVDNSEYDSVDWFEYHVDSLPC